MFQAIKDNVSTLVIAVLVTMLLLGAIIALLSVSVGRALGGDAAGCDP